VLAPFIVRFRFTASIAFSNADCSPLELPYFVGFTTDPPIIVVPIDIEIALVLLVHTYPGVPFKGNGRFQPVPSSELRPLARSFP
jgi:hypothetical protein